MALTNIDQYFFWLLDTQISFVDHAAEVDRRREDLVRSIERIESLSTDGLTGDQIALVRAAKVCLREFDPQTAQPDQWRALREAMSAVSKDFLATFCKPIEGGAA